MVLAVVDEPPSRQLTFGPNGDDPAEWLTKSTYPAYTTEQTRTFLALYIKTHRDALHPILLEALLFLRYNLDGEILEQMRDEAEEHIKGKGPRGRHAPKAKHD